MNENRVIALAAGGTGGHMFPAEALAQELKRRQWRVLLITDARGARYTKSFPADEQIELTAASPSIGGVAAKVKAAVSIAGGLIKALSVLRKQSVVAAVGFGGYPSFAGMKAASILKIPYGVHEQNGVLGRANRQLAPGATFVAHAFPVLEKTPEKAKKNLYEVGNPIRDAVKKYANAPYNLSDGDDGLSIVVFGGSQGASLFSDAPPKAIASIASTFQARIRVTHQAREREAAQVKAIYDDAGVDCDVAPFFDDLPARIADADLVIGRAGASTVTELSIIGRPSVLVPLAIAMDDHQTGNARALSDAGGAILLPEKDFTEARLKAALAPLVQNPQKLADMAVRAKGRVRDGAASMLADLVEDIAAQR